MEGRGRRRRSPQLFGVSTNIHYKLREEGEELERGRGGGGDTDKQQEVKDCWTEGREKQKGGILKEVWMKTEEEVKVAMEDGRREENLFLQIDVNHRRNPAQQ